MHQSNIISTIIIIMMLQTAAMAQIQFSGFADILFVQDLDDLSISEIQYGQFEFDLSAKIRPGITFEGALALNSETGTFEAGAGFIDITFTEGERAHVAKGTYLDHIGISIGQFDVPFGIDWQHIASPDRRFISAPLLNEKSINGWNDIGLNFHADRGPTSIMAFVVNGSKDGFAFGGRTAFRPHNIIELGASYFTQSSSNEEGAKPQVIGLDIQTVTGPLSTRAELHYSEDLFEGNFESIDAVETHHGFYGQADLDLEKMLNMPLVLLGRYDNWSTLNNSQEATRTTLGAAYTLMEGFEFRAEYLVDSVNQRQESPRLTIQTMVSF